MPAVNPISALPTYISPEEHRTILASTPSSFASIPPVLRHREDNISISLDPPLPSDVFSPQDAAQGSLYILTSVLVYLSSTGRGFQIEYPSITLHAISRGDPKPSIYCQLDETSGTGTEAVNGAGGDLEEDEVSEMRELSIVPQNPESLDPIFEALSQCASLHPDPADADADSDGGFGGEEGGDDAFIDTSNFETFDGDTDQELSEVGRAALAHLESIIYDPYDPESQGNGEGEGEELSGEGGDGKTGGENVAEDGVGKIVNGK